MATFVSYFQSWMPGSTSGGGPGSGDGAASHSLRTGHVGPSGCGPKIWPVAPQTAQELRKGVSFNMKVAIRGMRGTGKTTLFSRLCNLPTQVTYTPSQEISAGTIRVVGRGCAPHEGTKVDLWDVVDEGVSRTSALASTKLPSGQPITNQHLEALAALPADARNVDVYKDCHLVLFLIDPRSLDSLTYAVDHAQRVPHSIFVYFVLNFADTSASTHVISAEDMNNACQQVRRTRSTFIMSLTAGQSVPTNLSVGASWTALSASTGFGMRQLYLALNVPIAGLRASALERQLESLYQQMQWPSPSDSTKHQTNAAAHVDAATADHTSQEEGAEMPQPDNADEGVLLLEHRRACPPKPALSSKRPTTDSHGIDAGFFGSSDGEEAEEDHGASSSANHPAAPALNGHKMAPRLATPLMPGASPLSATAPSPAPASDTPPSVRHTAIDVAVVVSDRHGPDAAFFSSDEEEGEKEDEASAPVNSGAATAPSYTVKPLATQRIVSREAKSSGGRSKYTVEGASASPTATTTTDVSALVAQMEAALEAPAHGGELSPRAKKAPKERSRSHKSGSAKASQGEEPSITAAPQACGGGDFDVLVD